MDSQVHISYQGTVEKVNFSRWTCCEGRENYPIGRKGVCDYRFMGFNSVIHINYIKKEQSSHRFLLKRIIGLIRHGIAKKRKIVLFHRDYTSDHTSGITTAILVGLGHELLRQELYFQIWSGQLLFVSKLGKFIRRT